MENKDNKYDFKRIFFIVLKVILSLIIIYIIVFYSILIFNTYVIKQFWKEKTDFPFEKVKTWSNQIIKIEEKK